MQDVYRCWAWFEEQRQTSLLPVKLVVHLPNKFPPGKRSPFWEGSIIQKMGEEANVTFVEPDDELNNVSILSNKSHPSAFRLWGTTYGALGLSRSLPTPIPCDKHSDHLAPASST
jgi:hypothetical protein